MNQFIELYGDESADKLNTERIMELPVMVKEDSTDTDKSDKQ